MDLVSPTLLTVPEDSHESPDSLLQSRTKTLYHFRESQNIKALIISLANTAYIKPGPVQRPRTHNPSTSFPDGPTTPNPPLLLCHIIRRNSNNVPQQLYMKMCHNFTIFQSYQNSHKLPCTLTPSNDYHHQSLPIYHRNLHPPVCKS